MNQCVVYNNVLVLFWLLIRHMLLFQLLLLLIIVLPLFFPFLDLLVRIYVCWFFQFVIVNVTNFIRFTVEVFDKFFCGPVGDVSRVVELLCHLVKWWIVLRLNMAACLVEWKFVGYNWGFQLSSYTTYWRFYLVMGLLDGWINVMFDSLQSWWFEWGLSHNQSYYHTHFLNLIRCLLLQINPLFLLDYYD